MKPMGFKQYWLLLRLTLGLCAHVSYLHKTDADEKQAVKIVINVSLFCFQRICFAK